MNTLEPPSVSATRVSRWIQFCGMLTAVACLWAGQPSEEATAHSPQTADTYVVKQGDTLFQIARIHRLTIQEIRELNDLQDDTIRPGQVLKIRITRNIVGWNREERRNRVEDDSISADESLGDPPDSTVVAGVLDGVERDSSITEYQDLTLEPDTTGTAGYVIKEGDTLFSLAARLDIPVDSLARMNSQMAGRWRAGETLRIPEEKTVRDYRVRRGDTLFDIIRRFGIEMADLRAANQLRNSNIRIGQILHIPGQGVREAADPDELKPRISDRSVAVVYPKTFIGRITASGRTYDPARFTIGHPDLTLGTIVLLTVPETGEETFAEVTDRGFFSDPLLIDVSEAVARELSIDPLEGSTVEIRIVEGTGG